MHYGSQGENSAFCRGSSDHFEKNWHWYLIAVFVYYPTKKPVLFIIVLILIASMIAFPFFQYDLIG